MIESRAHGHEGPSHRGVREFVGFLQRRKLAILAPTVLIAAIAWAIALTTPARFTAEAVLALDVRKVQIVEHEVISRLPQESPALRTELDVISSRSLAEEVADQLGLVSDPDVQREAGTKHSPWQDVFAIAQQGLGRLLPGSFAIDPIRDDNVPALTRSQLTDWLMGNLKVSNDNRSLTILVSFTSQNPERAALVANAVADNYLADQIRTKAAATVRANDWLGEKLVKIRRELENSEAAVGDFRRQSGLIETRGVTIPAQRLSDLNSQLLVTRLGREQAEAKMQNARKGDLATVPEVLASPVIQQLRKDLAQINSEIAEEKDRRTVAKLGIFDKLSILEARKAALERQISQEMNRILASLSSEVDVARRKESELTDSFGRMEQQVGDVAHASIRLSQLQREADANRSIYETFLARYKQTVEQQDLAAQDARLISRAVPPSVPNYPKKPQFLLMGIFGGLMAGAAFGFVREGFDQRVRQVSEIEAVTGIPIFGLMPKVSRWRRLQPQDYPVSEPRSRFCTAIMRIHTALQSPNLAVRNQVILVTSAKSDEGKTSFCTSLARALAKGQTRVLVIDADPYRSGVASAFGFSNFRSSGESTRLGDIVQTDLKSGAHFIPAPSEDDMELLLHSGGFTALIEEARRTYDVIILDTPPVMTSANAALIGRFADTCLFLVRWCRTSWDEMTSAVGFLRLCGIRPDGIVIVGADSGHAHYGQSRGYSGVYLDHRFASPSFDPRVTAVFGSWERS